MTKKLLLAALLFVISYGACQAQSQTTIKEYVVKPGKDAKSLNKEMVYDRLGRKTEEKEYASYGQKSRTLYEYEGTTNRCKREVEYNDKNAVTKIKKFEYNPDGTKKKVYIYGPDGKLKSTRIYEYSAE